MIKLRHTVSAIALSTLLVLGACTKKDKEAISDEGGVIVKSVESNLKIKTADTKLIQKMLDVDNRKVSESEAEKALSEFGLMSSDNSNLNWDSKSGKTGDYKYKNLSFKSDDDKNVKIASLELEGVHMDGDNPSFDRANLSNITITDEDGRGTIDSVIFSRPHPKMAARVLKALGSLDSLDDLDMGIELEDGELGFGAMLLEGMDVSGDGGTIHVDTFGWGTDEATEKAAFLAKNISITGQDKESGTDILLTLKSASGADLDSKILRGVNRKNNINRGKTFNPLKTSVGNLKIEDLQLTTEGLNVSAVGVEASSTKRGNVTTETMVLRPVSIRFDEVIKDRDLAKAAKSLTKAGFDALEFTGQTVKKIDHKSGRVSVSNSSLSLKDGFDLSYNLDALGAVGDDWDNDDLQVEHLTIALTDNSIVDKIFTIAADMQGSSPQALRLQAKAGLAFAAAFAKSGEEKELISQLSGAAGDFLEKGGTLTIEINPNEPISMADVDSLSKNPTKNLERLGLSISHSE